jgi:predicted DNA-binding protein
MYIQSVRLDLDVCEPVNRLALDSRRTVTEVVNEVLREYLKDHEDHPEEQPAAG